MRGHDIWGACVLGVTTGCGACNDGAVALDATSDDRAIVTDVIVSGDVADALADVGTGCDAADTGVGPCLPKKPALAFVPISKGTFLMGSPKSEPGRGLYSETQVQVTLTHDFEISETEITQAQWDALCFEDPSGNNNGKNGDKDGIGPDYPAGNVTYWDAISYANALSTITGLPPCYVIKGCTCGGQVGHNLDCWSVAPSASTFYDCMGYRLPTDAEYEYANRAGTTTATYAGDVLPPTDAGVDIYPDPAIDTIGWCGAMGNHTTHVVKLLKVNAWGLYDLIGNAGEWVDGNFNGLGYGPGPLNDPFGTIGEAKTDGGPLVEGIIRGGWFNAINRFCRSAARLEAYRGALAGAGIGFRLVRTKK